jgi:hypothetical protein
MSCTASGEGLVPGLAWAEGVAEADIDEAEQRQAGEEGAGFYKHPHPKLLFPGRAYVCRLLCVDIFTRSAFGFSPETT